MGDLTVVRDLLEFSFESTVACDVPAAALQRLVRRSAVFNARMGLTGRLRVDGDRVVQTLEGRAAVLLPLAGRILADPRHGAIRITTFGAIGARQFTAWSVDGIDESCVGNDGGNLHFLPPRPDRRRAPTAAALGHGVTLPLTALSDA